MCGRTLSGEFGVVPAGTIDSHLLLGLAWFRLLELSGSR
jgi:hypothetical protein